MDDGVILVNEEALSESFIPDQILHREGQVKEIARSLAPALQNRGINNIFVIGSTGVGKTLVVKWILEEQFKGNSVYINCWYCRTTHKILEEILLQLHIPVHGKESTEELIKKLQKYVKRKVIVCLDEVDQLKEPEILYTLARKEIGIVMISNHSFMSWDLDSRVKSSLLLKEIEFRPYSHQELFSILKDRIGFALRPTSISDDLLRTVSVIAKGDARVGLLTLKAAARNAQEKRLLLITIEEVKHAIKGAKILRLSYLLKKLNQHQRVIYEILKKKVRMASGRLYEEYSKVASEPVVDRAYRNYMKRMIELGLVRVEGSGRWKKYEIVA
ncbi:MAG: Cdc6/Cdc18 family protein [Nitrososphaerales archaeon]